MKTSILKPTEQELIQAGITPGGSHCRWLYLGEQDSGQGSLTSLRRLFVRYKDLSGPLGVEKPGACDLSQRDHS